MATSGEDFTVPDFLATFGPVVRPRRDRPLVVRGDELQRLGADQVANPTELSIAGRLPTTTFELFRQVIGPGQSSDMHRHYHETVHAVVAGRGHSQIEDKTVTWAAGDFIYTPPWTWHCHYNDSPDEPVEFLTIESSRLLALLGLVRRQSAGLVTVEEARARFPEGDTDEH
jgi:quercetin dioxygenase-like cupin family protein